MKRLIGGLVLAIAPAVVFAGQSCNVDFHGGLRITQNAVEFSENNQLRYKIQGRSLWVDGHQLKLSDTQADQVQAYGDGIHALVPQAHQMAQEGVAMASDAVVMVLQAFSSDSTANSRKVQHQFKLLQADIDKSFQSPTGIYLGEGGKGDSTFPSSREFEAAFESNVQKIVEDVGSDIAWQAMKMIGWSIFSGGDTAAFEARMENFGKQMESTMDARGKKLEAQGQQLCVSIVALDQTESQLKAAVPELTAYDFIAVTNQTVSR